MKAAPSGKILVRGVNWLGDAVMTTPALFRLRAANPDAHIALLTHEKLADLWRKQPEINQVLTFGSGEGVFSISRKLRDQGFGTAIVFPNSFRSSLEVFLGRIARRVGYGGSARSLLLTHRVPRRAEVKRMRKRSEPEVRRRIAAEVPREHYPARAHHVHDYLHLVAALGASPQPVPPRLHVDDDEVASVRMRFGLPAATPLFVLNAGAEYGPAKRWPVERFVQAAILLHKSAACSWVLVGGRGDVELSKRITSELHDQVPHVLNLAGQTSLRELCALFRACELVITNDTGPMHVATAVGAPTVVPFGSTSPELTGPVFASNAQIVLGQAACAPCFLRECPVDFRCMTDITVHAVVNAALELLRKTKATRVSQD